MGISRSGLLSVPPVERAPQCNQSSFVIPYWVAMSNDQLLQVIGNGIHQGIPFSLNERGETCKPECIKKNISVVNSLATLNRNSVSVVVQGKSKSILKFRYDSLYPAEIHLSSKKSTDLLTASGIASDIFAKFTVPAGMNALWDSSLHYSDPATSLSGQPRGKPLTFAHILYKLSSYWEESYRRNSARAAGTKSNHCDLVMTIKPILSGRGGVKIRCRKPVKKTKDNGSEDKKNDYKTVASDESISSNGHYSRVHPSVEVDGRPRSPSQVGVQMQAMSTTLGATPDDTMTYTSDNLISCESFLLQVSGITAVTDGDKSGFDAGAKIISFRTNSSGVEVNRTDTPTYNCVELFGVCRLDEDKGASREESDADNSDCVICMIEPREFACLPCRHLSMCGKCVKDLTSHGNKCPICRKGNELFLRVPISIYQHNTRSIR